nr:MAG TPA: hypothetical protein [Caudoviricetes sp.]
MIDGQTIGRTIRGYSIVMNEKSQGNRGRFFERTGKDEEIRQ